MVTKHIFGTKNITKQNKKPNQKGALFGSCLTICSEAKKNQKKKSKTMPKLTVFLIRHGETIDEVDEEEDDENEEEDDEAQEGDELKKKTKGPKKLRLCEKVDPSLTMNGYLQSAVILTRLLKSLNDSIQSKNNDNDDNDEDVDSNNNSSTIRNLACFCAPFKSCIGTAMMMCCSNIHQTEYINNMIWKYTRKDTASVPTAIPIIVVNELGNQVSEINRLGGIQTVIDSGLLHCCASTWNNGCESNTKQNKIPIMKVINQEFKYNACEPVTEWKNERDIDEIRRVVNVQYLYVQDNVTNTPWNLKVLTPKINLINKCIEPSKYLTPHRKGGFDKKIGTCNKIKDILNIGPDVAVYMSIIQARQVGCDTILMFVPSNVISTMLDDCNKDNKHISTNEENNTIQAGTIASFIANVDDNTNEVWLQLHGLYSADDVLDNSDSIIPQYNGSIDCTIQPSTPDDDPSTLEKQNQWTRYPNPSIEVIPDDYPDLYVYLYTV
jgi:hypothetical protein